MVRIGAGLVFRLSLAVPLGPTVLVTVVFFWLRMVQYDTAVFMVFLGFICLVFFYLSFLLWIYFWWFAPRGVILMGRDGRLVSHREFLHPM